MKLKIIFSILLISSLIWISVDTAVAQNDNSDKCPDQGDCIQDQLRDQDCEEDCTPIGDENKNGQNDLND